MLHNTTPELIKTTDYFTSGYADMHPIRNLYLISNTLGTHNSMSVAGEWGTPSHNTTSSDINHLIYDQTASSIDYLDCSNQTLSIIDVKIKCHSGNIVYLHKDHVSFSSICVKAVDA